MNICKIIIKGGHGTGFFCKINLNNILKKSKDIFNFKTFLITNYHVINKDNIENNKIIFSLYDDEINKVLILDENRKTYFNTNYDIAIIEIKNTDEIKYFLELDDGIFKEESQKFYTGKSIYNISYPKNEQASVSYGILNNFNGNKMSHKCSTDNGSSGSPILNLKNNKVIGIHIGGFDNSNNQSNSNDSDNSSILTNPNNSNNEFNVGTFLKNPIIDFVQNNIKYFKHHTNNNSDNNTNSIQSFRNIHSHEIPSVNVQFSNLSNYTGKMEHSESHPNLFSYNHKFGYKNEAYKANTIEIKLLARKEDIKNKTFFLNESKEFKYEKDIEVIIDNQKTKKFKKYMRPQHEGIYTINLLFKQNITDCSEMFQDCKNIISIDLSNLITKDVTDMSYMFNNCSNLLNIKLNSFETQNVIKMKNMFCFCTKLNEINGLSSFNTSNVIDMHEMFFGCESLTKLNLYYFDFTNVVDIKYMLFKCKRLKRLFIKDNFRDRVIRESNAVLVK